MIITLDLTWITLYLPLVLMGFGIGYLCFLGLGQYKSTTLDHMKDDLEANKEWIRMLSERNKKQSLGVRR
jgi:hypothetical protein